MPNLFDYFTSQTSVNTGDADPTLNTYDNSSPTFTVDQTYSPAIINDVAGVRAAQAASNKQGYFSGLVDDISQWFSGKTVTATPTGQTDNPGVVPVPATTGVRSFFSGAADKVTSGVAQFFQAAAHGLSQTAQKTGTTVGRTFGNLFGGFFQAAGVPTMLVILVLIGGLVYVLSTYARRA